MCVKILIKLVQWRNFICLLLLSVTISFSISFCLSVYATDPECGDTYPQCTGICPEHCGCDEDLSECFCRPIDCDGITICAKDSAQFGVCYEVINYEECGKDYRYYLPDVNKRCCCIKSEPGPWI